MQKKILGLVATMFTVSSAIASTPEYKDHTVTGVNREDGRATFWYYNSREDALNASYINAKENISLNGSWKFSFAEKPADRIVDFYKDNADVSAWDDIQVPGNWPLQGYDKPIYMNHPYEFNPKNPYPHQIPDDWNPVGSYRRDFQVPKDWDGKRVVLHFGAVKSAFYVWVNGEKVGYSQDSKMQAEFDITPYLRFGQENNVSVEVYRFSMGSYIEGQDMWRLAGIKRNVWIYATDKNYVKDYFAATSLDDTYKDGQLSLNIEMGGKARNKGNLKVELISPEGEVVLTENIKCTKGNDYSFDAVIDDCQTWTAETPQLYTLLISHYNGKDSSFIASKVGFRRVELKNGLMLVNGEPIKIKGVNRHEHHPKFGHYIPNETMVEDAEMMKKLNINAVRMSHYPHDPYFYELCDEYGFYVCDEANIESHGLGAAHQAWYDDDKHIANNPEWEPIHHDRILRMFERDKNHASIIMWSMGNECGNGSIFVNGYKMMKELDPTRLVSFEQANTETHTDIVAPMYMTIDKIKNYVNAPDTYRPLILCEYSHAMGNSMGNFADYWDLFYKHDMLQGGFIWDWVDQGLETSRDGKRFFDYGGGFGQEHIYNDGPFCLNGIVNPDREPNPHAMEVFKVHQGVSISKDDRDPNAIKFINRFDFTNLNKYDTKWTLLENGKTVESGSIALDLEPGKLASIANPYTYNVKEGNEYLLNIELFTKEKEGLLEKGHRIAYEQLPIQLAVVAVDLDGKGKLDVEETDRLVVVEGDNFKYAFDKNSGRITSLESNGKNYLTAATEYDFHRVPVDNDLWDTDAEHWKDAHERATLKKFEVNKEKGLVTIVAANYIDAAKEERLDATFTTTYTIYPNGTIEVDHTFVPTSTHIEFPISLPRLGELYQLDGSLDVVEWYGRGPWESYADRKTSAIVGNYTMPVEAMHHSYIHPQENGYRTDTKKIELKDKNGASISFIGKQNLGFTAQNHSKYDYYNEDGARIRNTVDLKKHDTVFLNIDYGQKGVGGDNSWGNPVHVEYRVLLRAYKYGYYITFN